MPMLRRRKSLFAEAKRAFGRLDILVNNAGVYQFSPLEGVTENEFHREFQGGNGNASFSPNASRKSATLLRFAPFTKREVMPGDLKGAALENFIRDAASTYWHQTCTAKMGRDSMSVVDANLNVYGIENLRVADGSIMPRITTGNTMAPCVVIGERAAEVIRIDHELSCITG